MIYKSYLVEENVELIKNNIILFFGENLGLINDFKENLKKKYKSTKIIKIKEDEILKNENLFFNEIKNLSLFEEEKVIFIDNVSDKILDILKEVKDDTSENKIYLFGNILEKKSKLRSYAEKSDYCDVVICYKDNEINLKKLIINRLKDYSGVNQNVINLLLNNSELDRVKLNNELNKISNYFIDKNIEFTKLEELLNSRINENFNLIKDTALKGNSELTNKLLGSTIFENEKIPLYLNMINQRLNRLKELVMLSKKTNLSNAINLVKPPIFWKDKPNFIDQAKIWNNNSLTVAQEKIYELELKIKSNSDINKNILIKKFLLDICLMART